MDTSTTISALLRGWLKPVADAVADNRLELACSRDLVGELARVLQRSRLASRISNRDILLLRSLYGEQAMFFDVGPYPQRCRDPLDDYLLALASASQADYLVTRDADLLVLKSHERTEIIYPARFLQLISPPNPP